jgi:tetratricopeptide (TPR) repeat protein
MAFNKAKAMQEAENLVVQGKISQAIKRYFDIFEKDPSELILLNTIGDLYIRDKNVSEGLKQFYRLAEAYVQDGFNLKAIAIYKKIVKLEPDSVDPLLKLVELYQAQRLGREARELCYQVADCYKKKRQNDKALETLRKVVQMEAENAAARARLAAFCEEIGRKDEAAQVYLETAQLTFRRGDTAAGQMALKKAQELAPNDPQVQLAKAREALALKHPEKVEAILSATPALKDDPAGRSLLIDSYLAMQQPEKAETLVLGLFRATPTDFSPLASFVSVCVQVGRFDTATKALAAVADELIKQRTTSPLMASLRQIWGKSPQHVPTLELILRICDETRDEDALPEILEALGNTYVQCGQFEKAEEPFQRLLSREPANERYKGLLRNVLQKQGKELGKAGVAELPSPAAAPTQEKGAPGPTPPFLHAADRETAVKEALENSELYARYHLVKKAVAELDRILEVYPDEAEVHRRLVGMCWKDMPERAEQAAQALSRIYTQQGDAEGAKRFARIAGGRDAPAVEAPPPQAVPAPTGSPGPPPPPPPAQPAPTAAGETAAVSASLLTPVQVAEATATPQVSPADSAGVTIEVPPPAEQEAPGAVPVQSPLDLSASQSAESPTTTAPEMSLDASIPPASEAPPPLELPLDLATPPPSAPPLDASSEIHEIDLSEDWQFFLTHKPAAAPAPEAPQEAVSFNYDDSRIEVNFYLEQGFVEEARRAVEDLERTLPGDPRIAELRALVEAETGAPVAEVAEKQPEEEALKPTSLEAVAPPAEEVVEQVELASSYGAPEPEPQPASAPPISLREEEVPAEATLGVGVEPASDLLSDFTEAFESAGGGEEIPARATLRARVEPMTDLVGDLVAASEPAKGGEEIPTEATLGVTAEPKTDLLGDLVEALESARGGLEEPSPLPAPPSAPTVELATGFTAPTPAQASPLSGLLEEIGEAPGAGPVEEDDPETHYSLGVAFREMKLLDEAIGEFQKVVKRAGKTHLPPNYLQACTLLARCFMDKGMAPLAVKWYGRALETPDLDEEAWLALQYDLGVAYEQAGDLPRALEKFSEVYSQNIDFRDVAQKIRTFQQKGS